MPFILALLIPHSLILLMEACFCCYRTNHLVLLQEDSILELIAHVNSQSLFLNPFSSQQSPQMLTQLVPWMFLLAPLLPPT